MEGDYDKRIEITTSDGNRLYFNLIILKQIEGFNSSKVYYVKIDSIEYEEFKEK